MNAALKDQPNFSSVASVLHLQMPFGSACEKEAESTLTIEQDSLLTGLPRAKR